MPNLTNRIAPIQKPPRHILRAAEAPIRHDLLRLHVLEAGLFEVLLDARGGRPFRIRDDGRFEFGVEALAGFGPGGREARVDGVDPCVEGEDAAWGDDAVEFLDAGGAVVGEVDECASEGVGDAVGGDALG